MSRRIQLAAVAVLALTPLTSCSHEAPPDVAVPQGGVDAQSGPVVLNDVWVDSPHAIRTGRDATLRLSLTNDGDHPDALVSVSTPVAHQATLSIDGNPVNRIPLSDHQAVDLEWHDGSGVILHDLRRTIRRGYFFNVTFGFAHSPPVTMAVTVGPLGGSLTSAAP